MLRSKYSMRTRKPSRKLNIKEEDNIWEKSLLFFDHDYALIWIVGASPPNELQVENLYSLIEGHISYWFRLKESSPSDHSRNLSEGNFSWLFLLFCEIESNMKNDLRDLLKNEAREMFDWIEETSKCWSKSFRRHVGKEDLSNEVSINVSN